MTSDVDEQPCDSNAGSADKSAGQSRSRMTASLPTLKGDAKERIRHASPAMMECDFRAEERHESRDMDIKSRIDFKPRAMRSEFQTNMRDEFPRKQFEDLASDAGSAEDKRRDKSLANRICTVRVADDIGPTVLGNRYGLDVVDWANFSSVSEFPQCQKPLNRSARNRAACAVDRGNAALSITAAHGAAGRGDAPAPALP